MELTKEQIQEMIKEAFKSNEDKKTLETEKQKQLELIESQKKEIEDLKKQIANVPHIDDNSNVNGGETNEKIDFEAISKMTNNPSKDAEWNNFFENVKFKHNK